MNLDPATVSSKISSLEVVIFFVWISIVGAIICLPLFTLFYPKKR